MKKDPQETQKGLVLCLLLKTRLATVENTWLSGGETYLHHQFFGPWGSP